MIRKRQRYKGTRPTPREDWKLLMVDDGWELWVKKELEVKNEKYRFANFKLVNVNGDKHKANYKLVYSFNLGRFCKSKDTEILATYLPDFYNEVENKANMYVAKEYCYYGTN